MDLFDVLYESQDVNFFYFETRGGNYEYRVSKEEQSDGTYEICERKAGNEDWSLLDYIYGVDYENN